MHRRPYVRSHTHRHSRKKTSNHFIPPLPLFFVIIGDSVTAQTPISFSLRSPPAKGVVSIIYHGGTTSGISLMPDDVSLLLAPFFSSTFAFFFFFFFVYTSRLSKWPWKRQDGCACVEFNDATLGRTLARQPWTLLAVLGLFHYWKGTQIEGNNCEFSFSFYMHRSSKLCRRLDFTTTTLSASSSRFSSVFFCFFVCLFLNFYYSFSCEMCWEELKELETSFLASFDGDEISGWVGKGMMNDKEQEDRYRSRCFSFSMPFISLVLYWSALYCVLC